MPIIENELTFSQKELKKFLRHGDRVAIQRKTKLSKQAVYQTLTGGRLAINAVWEAAAAIVNERKEAQKKLDEIINNAIS